MVEWQITYSDSNRQSFFPGLRGSISGFFTNKGSFPVFVDELGLKFDWQIDEWYSQRVKAVLNPGGRRYFSVGFVVPQDIVGVRTFRPQVALQEAVPQNIWNGSQYIQSYQWSGLEHSEASQDSHIVIRPSPTYSAFISRSVNQIDANIIEPIVTEVRNWGFKPLTVGINVKPPIQQVPEYVRQGIINSDCLIAIATKRDRSAITGLWKTLEWLHNEVGGAFVAGKPIIVLADYEVQLGGLPSVNSHWVIPFDEYNVQAAAKDLARKMPNFRNQIAEKKKNDFLNGLIKIGIPLVAGVGLGALLCSSR